MRTLIISFLASLAGCTAISPVDIQYNPATNFGQYRTFQWEPVPEGMNTLMYARIRASLDRALVEHKFARADPAQFSVSSAVFAQEKVQTAGAGKYGGEYGYSSWGPASLWSALDHEGHENHVHRATLVILIYDANSHDLIWRGAVTKDLVPAALTPQVLDQIVDAGLTQFPPNIRCDDTVQQFTPCRF